MRLSSEVLPHWARLGARLRELRVTPSFANSFARLIPAAMALRAAEFDLLTNVIERSNELLKPLGEPLSRDFGLNRWLYHSREEEYSDWLMWLFSQMNVGELTKVLSLHELHADLAQIHTEPAQVSREVWVEHGHDDQQGRVDLTLTLRDLAVIIVEVKKGSARYSDTKKQIGYKRSIESRIDFLNMKKQFIILAPSADEELVDGFQFRSYHVLCRNIRRLAASWMGPEYSNLYKTATSLMVAATIESNLLHLSTRRNEFTENTLCHLRKFTERLEYE